MLYFVVLNVTVLFRRLPAGLGERLPRKNEHAGMLAITILSFTIFCRAATPGTLGGILGGGNPNRTHLRMTILS
jgi:hypothetical protein